MSEQLSNRNPLPPELPAERARTFQMNRGAFEEECRKRGLEPLPFAQWLVLHYLASQMGARPYFNDPYGESVPEPAPSTREQKWAHRSRLARELWALDCELSQRPAGDMGSAPPFYCADWEARAHMQTPCQVQCLGCYRTAKPDPVPPTASPSSTAAASMNPMKDVPRNASWFRLFVKQAGDVKEYKAHWAADLSGEEQPAFQGFFYEVEGMRGFQEVPGTPIGWLPIAVPEPVPPSSTASGQHKWNRDGERCELCGDKDWMGGPCSGVKAVPEPAAPIVPATFIKPAKYTREQIATMLKSGSINQSEAEAMVIEVAPAAVSDAQIKHMVGRFLGWKLPENFNPDGGISFKKAINENRPTWPQKNEPTGTNVFDADQAEAMVRYMVEGLPIDPARTDAP